MCWKLNTKFCAKLADYVRKFAAADGWSVRSEVPGGEGMQILSICGPGAGRGAGTGPGIREELVQSKLGN